MRITPSRATKHLVLGMLCAWTTVHAAEPTKIPFRLTPKASSSAGLTWGAPYKPSAKGLGVITEKGSKGLGYYIPVYSMLKSVALTLELESAEDIEGSPLKLVADASFADKVSLNKAKAIWGAWTVGKLDSAFGEGSFSPTLKGSSLLVATTGAHSLAAQVRYKWTCPFHAKRNYTASLELPESFQDHSDKRFARTTVTPAVALALGQKSAEERLEVRLGLLGWGYLPSAVKTTLKDTIHYTGGVVWGAQLAAKYAVVPECTEVLAGAVYSHGIDKNIGGASTFVADDKLQSVCDYVGGFLSVHQKWGSAWNLDVTYSALHNMSAGSWFINGKNSKANERYFHAQDDQKRELGSIRHHGAACLCYDVNSVLKLHAELAYAHLSSKDAQVGEVGQGQFTLGGKLSI